MNIIIMNFLNFAIPAVLLGLASSASGFGPYDLERIRTVEGREYRGILILEADRNGLSFRHDRGIAKLPFSSLSENLRMLYEVIDEDPTEVEPGEATALVTPEEMALPELRLPLPIVLLARSRVNVPAPALCLGGGYGATYQRRWPAWWPRYHHVHGLAHPYFRELAVRDFLYSSGLLAPPPGVVVRTVYR